MCAIDTQRSLCAWMEIPVKPQWRERQENSGFYYFIFAPEIILGERKEQCEESVKFASYVRKARASSLTLWTALLNRFGKIAQILRTLVATMNFMC